MKNRYGRRGFPSTDLLILSIFVLADFPVGCEPVLCSFYRIQGTRAARTIIHHSTGSVTAPREGYWQIPLSGGFCTGHGEKCLSQSVAGFAWHLRTGTSARSVFQSCLRHWFRTRYTRGLCGFSPGVSRSEPGLLVLRSEPRCQVRIYSMYPYSAVKFLLREPATWGGRTAGLAARAGGFFSVRQESGRFVSTEGELKCPTAPTEGRDVVELTGEVVPSRVKGPVSRFTVCLLHGLLGSRRNMRTIGSYLAAPRVLALDLRNHGQSPWRDTMTIDDLARDVLHTLRERASHLHRTYPAESFADSCTGSLPSLKFKNTTKKPPVEVVLVGHSLGGLVAMRAATLAARHATNHCCSTSRPAMHIAGVVGLDIAPIDYTSPSEQKRLRTHQEKTGTPSTEDIVQLLVDLPMHLIEDRKQLERTLRTATSPPLPAKIVSWLMTGVRESTTNNFNERLRIRAASAAPSETAVERCRSDEQLKNMGDEWRRPCQSQPTRLGWQANIHAIRHMLVSKQLGWRFTDCPVLKGTRQCGHCESNEAHHTQPCSSTGKLLEPAATMPTCTCQRSSGTPASRPAVGCGVYSLPALFLKGSESPYIDLEKHWDQTLAVFPNAQCKVVPGAGHWLHADNPQRTADYINDFLLSI